MDHLRSKHVQLTYVMNKTQSLKHFVYLVGLHMYYKMIHGPYNIKLRRNIVLCVMSSVFLHIHEFKV